MTNHASTTHAIGMANCDSATVDVEIVAGNPQLIAAVDYLHRKGFVEFDDVHLADLQAGKFENNWLGTVVIGNYGDDYYTRAAANLVGIWANASNEVIYFVATRDSDGQPLVGSNEYTIHFPSDGKPETVVDAYWSVILVDIPDYRVVPNRLDRFNFNSYSSLKPNADGSLAIQISAEPKKGAPESNWLPAPDGPSGPMHALCPVRRSPPVEP